MERVVLKPLLHRGMECIGIYFDIHFRVNGALRKTALARFSQTHKCWYVPLSKENYNKIYFALQGIAELDQSALHLYLSDRKGKIKTSLPKELVRPEKKLPGSAVIHAVQESNAMSKVSGLAQKQIKAGQIQAVNAHVLPAMQQRLRLKAYSSSTAKTYMNEMAQLLQTINTISADDLTPEQLRRYLVFCYDKLKLTENTLHSRINAMKFYYEQVLGREKFFWEIPRPKKQFQMPRFFNQDEVTAIIKAAGNVKHKTMLMLAYSSGLRVSEVVAIKTKNIDSKRMCILVEQAKGKKDRVVMLSPVLLVMLREYWKAARPSKDGHLFQGQYKGEPYSSRSLQLVLAAAKKKAVVMKPGSVHALRHSFATHLLDKGTDVTMIMKLLGHNDIKTTLRYLHVTNRDMLQIISPLDELHL
jgi:integrase/recombinase XerD